MWSSWGRRQWQGHAGGRPGGGAAPGAHLDRRHPARGGRRADGAGTAGRDDPCRRRAGARRGHDGPDQGTTRGAGGAARLVTGRLPADARAAEALRELLDEMDVVIDAVLVLDVADDVIVARISRRLTAVPAAP